MLKAERISCSGPKLSDAQTRNFEAIKHTCVPKVPSTMIVSAHGEKMSVPRRCIGRPVKAVRMPDGAMDCYMAGELVATHLPGDRVYDPAHYAEAMACKRWFGDVDIDAAAAANLDLLDSIGGSL